MNLDQVLHALEKAGTAQNRKVYARHGAKEPMFGVGYAALYALQKQLGIDQELAESLWDCGNHDARVLATLVADGERVKATTLKAWMRAADNRFLAMAFSALAARCKVGVPCALAWIDGNAEFEQAAGWGALAGAATGDLVGDEVLAGLLPVLQQRLHTLPNFARYAANNCLIAIGGRPALAAAALAVAKVVGAVEVDHGDTSCKTPLAAEYIAKMAQRRAAKKAPAAKKAAAKPAPAAKAKSRSR